ncbi:MAG: PAS domain S-box protein [Betaproteobacteria bacterium]
MDYEHLRREELIAFVRVLTERERASGDAARESETRSLVFGAREQADFEGSPYPIRIFDRETLQYLAVNDAAVKLYGYTHEEFLKLTLYDTRHPDGRSEIAASLEQPTGYMRHFPPRKHLSKAGAPIMVELIVQDIVYHGRLARLSLTMDVTQRETMEENLRRREREFSALVEHAPDLIARFDRNLRFLYANPAVSKAMKVARRAFIGKTSVEIKVPPALAAVWGDEIQRVFENRQERTVDFECPCHDGTRQFEARLVPECDRNGTVETVLTISRDITERKRAQAELRRSEERMQQLMSMSPAAIFSFSIDPPYGTTYISDNVTAQVGWQPSDFIGSSSFWYDHVHPEDRPPAEEAVRRLRIEGRSACEYRFLDKYGNWRWMRDEQRVVCDADGAPSEGIGIWIDVTAQREEMEVRLQQTIRQRDALVKEVHHRIKNHLQGIAGLLREQAIASRTLSPLVDTVIAQMKSVALVYGLQTGADEEIALRRIVDEICTSIEGLTTCRIIRNWERHNAASLHLAASAAVPVAVALNELVYNAVKHSESAGCPATVDLEYQERGDRAEIRIANGGSLPEDFHYASGAGCGTGLGLVKTLLDPKGSTLTIRPHGKSVETHLTLESPLVVLRPLQTAA